MATETLCISKEINDNYSITEVINTFKQSESLDEIKAVVDKAEDRIFVSWASVDGVDKDGEKIPIDLIIKAQEELMKRGAPIMYRHTNKNVGKTLAYRVESHPKTGKLGVLHLNQIYSGLPIDDDVWQDIKNGKLKGLSVGGQGVIGSKEYNENLKSMIDVYSKFGQFETSIVENPSNPMALNEAVSAVAKEEKMTEENKTNFEEVMKEVSESIKELKNDVASIKKSFEEVKKEEPVQEPVKEEIKEESSEVDKEEPSRLDSLESTVTKLSETVSSLVQPAEKEDKKEDEEEDKDKKSGCDTKKEESVEKEEETVTMEAPSVNVEKEESTKDVYKEYNENMRKFEKGELTYEQVLEQYRKQ